MSALPAASSFSGAEGSEGASGRTSRPAARKSPWAIAEYSAAWSALGKKSSITVNGLTDEAEITSRFWPQADRTTVQDRAMRSAASRAPRRGADGRLNGCLLSIDAPTAPSGARRGQGHRSR